ncbi:MAG: glutaminyl-peptide cyclotransferase [Candidatus Omnitrophota bacterium]
MLSEYNVILTRNGAKGKNLIRQILRLRLRMTIFLLLGMAGFLFWPQSRVLSEEQVPFEKSDDYGNIPVRVMKKIPLPGGYHEGLLFDGENVWVNNGKGGKTWIVDLAAETISAEIKPIATFTEGMTSVGDGTFWITDWETQKLYLAKRKENEMIATHEMSLNPEYPAGVIWTGKKLYVITWRRGPTGTRYFLVRFNNEGREISRTRIKGIHEPAHLAWDGKDLWITSWFSQRVYRIDEETLDITGSFKSPASKTTGIACDGKYFWITGSYDDLYQIEIE